MTNMMTLDLETCNIVYWGRTLFNGLPQLPNQPPFGHALVRQYGDHVCSDGVSAANELIVTGIHVGTRKDALAHVIQDGALNGGWDARHEQVEGVFMVHGVETIQSIFTRVPLLDTSASFVFDVCEPGYEVTADDLEVVRFMNDLEPEAGDVILVHTGWGRCLDEVEPYLGLESGVLGVSEAGARWVAEWGSVTVGGGSIVFERLAPCAGNSILPTHWVLPVENGIYVIETMELGSLPQASSSEFLFATIPLKVEGATGSPVGPIANFSEGTR